MHSSVARGPENVGPPFGGGGGGGGARVRGRGFICLAKAELLIGVSKGGSFTDGQGF